MITIRRWTGRESRALREAMRMSTRHFAGQLGVSARAVSKWEAGGAGFVPGPDSQAILDAKLRQVPDEVRARFEVTTGTAPDKTAGMQGTRAAAPQEPGLSDARDESLAFAGGNRRTPNLILRQIREDQRHETRSEFAEALAAKAREIGDYVYPSERYIARLEDGEIRYPHPPYRRALTALCGKSMRELGFERTPHKRAQVREMAPSPNAETNLEPRAEFDLMADTGPATASGYIPSTSDWAHADISDVDDVERRELLKIMGGMALAAPLSGRVDADTLRRELDSTLNALTTKSDVEEWERVVAQFSAESGGVPPALLLPELLTDLDEALLRLKGSPDALRAPMARVCGYLSALAAMNFFNAGNERNARRYWRTALRFIDQTGDRPAQAELYDKRAQFTLLETPSSPSTALALVENAISISGGTPCAGATSAYGTRAMALTLLGDHGASARAVQDLSDTYTRMPGARISARSSWGFSEQQLHFIEGHVYAYAGRPSDAVKALDAGLSMVPDGKWIAVTSFEVNRAICLIRAGDPSEGARHIVRAVQALPTGYRKSGAIRRASLALDAVPDGAANVPAVAEARELLSLPLGTGA